MIKKQVAFTLLILALFWTGTSADLQDPHQFFGKKIGADRTLIPYTGIVKYFKYLGEESPRISVTNEGNSTEDHPLIAAFISSEENIQNLDRLIEINRMLANPDEVPGDQPASLVAEGRVFVIITCGIHATEIASTQFSMLLAHELATTDCKQKGFILDQMVLLLMPSINPDGNIMVTDWYNRYLDTEHEGSMMPYLYHKYAGHDTNRDYYMLNLRESRIVNAVLHHKYFPQVFLDMHQMGSTGARMFVPPFYNPYNKNLDPVLLKETELIGTSMALKLQQNDKTGVASGYAFDAYWPGGTKNTAWFKNVVGILTELASVAVASPLHIEENELRIDSKGLPEYKAQVNFPTPWRGGWWRLGDIIEYERIAVDALLETAAKFKDTFLTNFYRTGMKAVQKGQNSPPWAYHIPGKQWDPGATMEFLNRMKEGAARIYRLTRDHTAEDRLLREGDYLIPLAQPYGNFVRVMMEKQHYPEIRHMSGGPIIEPYDVCGWTLPLLMGVETSGIQKPLEDPTLERVTDLDSRPVIRPGPGTHYRIPGRYNQGFALANRLLQKKHRVFRFTGTPGDSLSTGDFLIPKSEISETALKKLLEKTSLAVDSVSPPPAGSLRSLSPPKIGIYQPYIPSMDEGWTRWVLDYFGFHYTVLHREDLQDKGFSKKIDVLIIADIPRDILVEGTTKGWYRHYLKKMPSRYQGGMGKEGIENIKSLLKNGGNLILLDSAWELAREDLELPIQNVLAGISRDRFYCPGSILKIELDPGDPVAWGMPAESILFFSQSAAFHTSPPLFPHITRRVVGRYPDRPDHLLSGFIKGERLLNRAAAIVRFTCHDGNVVVLGGRVQNRGQTFATFKLLFNAIFL